MKCLEIKEKKIEKAPAEDRAEEEEKAKASRFAEKRSSSISVADPVPPLIGTSNKAFHHPPVTTEVFRNTSKRMFYMRRERMIDKSLLIMNFDGVLGDLRRSNGCLAGSPTETIYFRAGMVKGVKQLISKFQIVAVITGFHSVLKAKAIRDALVKTGVGFDGIYTMLPKYY